MKNKNNRKGGFSAFYKLCPVWHTIGLISGLIIILHLLTRHNKQLMKKIAAGFVQPYHQFMAKLCAKTEYSVAEIIILLAAVGVIAYLIYSIICLVKNKERLKRLYKLIVPLISFGLLVYAAFCMFWGVYYYADDFITQSGLKAEKISVSQLEAVTEYFAEIANEYSGKVNRDQNGLYRPDKKQIVDKSPELYENAEKDFPCLKGAALKPKLFKLSKILSYTDFTGFFFPFTGEANINNDFPPSLFASTVAHELAHQRGIAKEQEANFAAVLVSMESDDPDFIYSAALLAYTHLGNALSKADYEAWHRIYSSLSDNVLRDFAENRIYWKQFEGPAQTTMNKVYGGFLDSFDQKLKLKSYGACVDLLVNYYYEDTLK